MDVSLTTGGIEMTLCTDCGKDLANDIMDSGECWDCFTENELASEASEVYF